MSLENDQNIRKIEKNDLELIESTLGQEELDSECEIFFSKNVVQKRSGSYFFPSDISPSSIVFWRHFVALFMAMIVLGSGGKWSYGFLHVTAMNLGALIWAVVVAALLKLFLTERVSFWSSFIKCAWLIAFIVVFENLYGVKQD